MPSSANTLVLPDLLPTILAVSLTAINVLRPCYAPDTGALIDFSLEYLNPAAQRMTGLGERPGGTMRTQFADTFQNGVFAFYQRVFETHVADSYAFNYQADGFDNYFRVAAQRAGEFLVVSFTDTADQPRTAVEQALRASQARERAARAETEAALREAQQQRTLLYQILNQVPAYVATFSGPAHQFSFFNEQFTQALTQSRARLGVTFADLFPELVEQGFLAVLDGVYASGQDFALPEAQVVQRDPATGQARTTYVNVVYKPLRDAAGQTQGLLAFASDITEQVRARAQVQTLDQELQASNQEYLTTNATLGQTQQQLAQLNRELENRVREQTRQVLQQSVRLERLLAEAPAAICMLDGPELVFELVNPGYQQLFPDRELLGKSVFEVLPEIVGGPVEAMLRGVYQTGTTFEGNEVPMYFARPGDGQLEERYFNFIYQARYAAAGQLDGLVVFAFEVTEQVQARARTAALQAQVLAATQQQVLAREEVFQVFEQAPVVVALLRGPAHLLHYRNPAFQALFPGRSLLGRPYAEALPEIVAAGLMPKLDRVYATGQPYYGTAVPFATTPPDGSSPPERYYDFSYEPYREAGEQVGVSIFAYDVTDQVAARRELDHQRAQLQHLFEQAPVPIFLLRGPAYVLEVVNPAMSELLGQPVAQLLGRPYFEALPELATQGYAELLARVWRTGEAVSVSESPARLARHQPGETGYYSFVYQPLHADGQFTAILCMAVDVTEQVRARQRVQDLNQELTLMNKSLHASNAQLTRTNADLDTFVYTASHDLKAPITNIEGLLEVLRDYLPTADQAPLVPQLVERMQRAIARFQQTVGHLTDVARLQHPSGQPPEALDLARAVEDVRQDLLPLLESTRAQLQLDVAACPPLRFSPKDLRSILYNLLSNALKYRAPERLPLVQVRARCVAQQVVVEVQDNGLGLSEAQQGKLFTMFKRLHTHVEGSGVGLYLIKRLIENAGGTITVQSQLGEGSTFTVTLPLA